MQLERKIARLPGRNVWRINHHKRDDLYDSKVVADSLAAIGYALFGWDIEWNYTAADQQLETADDLLFRIGQMIKYHKSFTPNHIVILCHDPALKNALNLTQLKDFIRKGRQEKQYRFRFLSEYPTYQTPVKECTSVTSTPLVSQPPK